MKEFADADLIQRVLKRFAQPSWPSQTGSFSAEIEDEQLVLKYSGTGEKQGIFKTVVQIPQRIGDEIWNEYVEESRDITYWIDWAVISPVERPAHLKVTSVGGSLLVSIKLHLMPKLEHARNR